jgi:uridine kinase
MMRAVRTRLTLLTDTARELLAERSLPRRLAVKITVGSHVHEVATGTAVQELLPTRVDDQLVVGALLNHRASSLVARLSADCALAPLTTAHWEGQRIYQRSLALLLVEAAHRVAPDVVMQLDRSVGLGQAVRVEHATEGLPELAARVESEMRAIAERDEPLREEWWTVDEARTHFDAVGWHGAAELLRSRYEPAVRLASYGRVYAFRTGPFVPRAGMMRGFSVLAEDSGLLLVFGRETAKRGRQSIWPGDEAIQKEARSAARHTDHMTRHHERWLSALGIASIGEFNAACVDGNVGQIIRVAEGFQEKSLSVIADAIHERADALKVITVAGPSSSGKSTFIRRLIVQLQVNGMNPVGLGLDDYYCDREETPRDESGEYDFEAFEALRLDLLHEHTRRLLGGERVKTARYDFKQGKSRPDGGRELGLDENDVLLLEGIHGLNPHLLRDTPAEKVFRIFICPLATLPIDRVSQLHASDMRLVRRIVRDRHNRGATTANTITRWPSVRRGERRHVFPFQSNADAVFDSSLIYELSVLRVFAERYLLEVPRDDEANVTAHRLLQLISHFITIYPDHVPPNSILREFIGGSGFEY